MINFKKGLIQLSCALLCLVFAAVIPASAEEVINDPLAEAVMLEVMQFLEGDVQAQLLFAAEMELSNGPPDTRDYGERGMFGKLRFAWQVLDNLAEYAPRVDEIWEEANRLLFGPWKNDGRTVFSFVTRKNVRILDFETGEWCHIDQVECVKATHYTEISGKKRSMCFSIATGQPVKK